MSPDAEPNPMDEIEARTAMRGIARMVRAFYLELVAEGFREHEALSLTGRYVAGLASTGGGS